MNEARQQRLLQGHTTLAQKVFDYVPIQEAWTAAQINAAIRNTSSTTANHRAVRACLGDMKDQGLIREVSSGLFQRHSVKHIPKILTQGNEEMSAKEVIVLKRVDSQLPETDAPKQEESAIDLLAALSTEVIELADEFGGRLKKLASRIEEVALSVEAEREKNAEALGKLEALKTILHSLNTN